MLVMSPINQLGYGIAGLNIVKSLAHKTDVALFCIGQPQVTNQDDANIIQKCMNKSWLFSTEDPCIKIWHQNDMAQFAGRGKRIGFPFFELDEFNPIEQHHLSSLDSIFVSSEWAKSIILDQIKISKDQVFVVPLAVDSNLFKPNNQTTNNNATIFLNCGKWEIRKGHDVLCEVFNQAFNNDDDVELWLLCENPFLTQEQQNEWINMYKKSKLGHKIRVFPRQETQQEVYNIMSNCDCGIFPSRAEGWNLELLEIMSCGKHVIATNYSAHTEFCNKDNAYLINITDKEIAFDGKWFNGKCGKWAKISQEQKDECVYYLRQIHQLKQENKLNINQNGIETADKLNWDTTAQKILEYV